MATQDAAKKAYRFLRERSFSQEPFTYADLAAESGWSVATIKTYISKYNMNSCFLSPMRVSFGKPWTTYSTKTRFDNDW